MSNSKAKRHIHKYCQQELGSSTVWACGLPDCPHYMPEYMTPLLNGKYSLCWQCGERMILHPINMEMKQPVCDTCRLGVDLMHNLREIVPATKE